MGRFTRKEHIKSYRMTNVDGQRELVHRQIAEKALGRPLPDRCVIHHVSGIDDNSRLVICEDQAYHLGLHRRLRVLRAGGRPFLDHVCGKCGEAKPSREMDFNHGYANICKWCRRAKRRRAAKAKAARIGGAPV